MNSAGSFAKQTISYRNIPTENRGVEKKFDSAIALFQAKIRLSAL
jgi:hypothetical protein